MALLGLMFCFSAGYGQNLDINPSVQWRFVISHEINFASGNFISYEFPAERGYDYIFNITHNLDSVHAAIMVFDLQDRLVEKMVLEENQLSIDLPFDVQHNGTYKVVLGLTDPNGKKGDIMPGQFTLIRRIKV